LVFGWLRAVHPTFGRIPEPAMWVFDTVGLTVFMACVGLAAGPSFFSGLQKSGLRLVFVGLIIAILPHTVAIVFGRYVLKMNPVIVLGACSGAGTITAALRAIQGEAQSELPAPGYTGPYAIANIVLTAWGPALATGAYGVVGASKSFEAGLAVPACIFVGVVNAVGSGLIRDVLVRDEPLLLRPGQFYVIASVLGVGGFALLVIVFGAPVVPSAITAIAITFVFRLLAIFFDWKTTSVIRPPPPIEGP